MFMKWKVVIMGATIAAMALTAGGVIAAAPYVAAAQAATATAAPGATSGLPNGGPRGGDEQPDLPGLQERDLLNSAAASLTGLTVPDIISQTQAGQTLAQIVIAKGKTAADLIAAARTALSTGLQQAVTAGTITQADADAELAEYDANAPQMVNNAGPQGLQGGFGDHDSGGPRTEDALVTATASVTGLTAPDVISQTQSGQSLTQIATAKGKTAADVISAARASLVTQLGQAVTAGTLTQAQSDAALAAFDQDAPQIMADTNLHAGGPGFGPGGQRGPGGAGALIQAAVTVTGLTDQEIDAQLQAGQSLAQIAQAKGRTADDIIAAARTALTTQLQAAVTAGKLTQAQADARLAQFNTSATQLVNDATLGQHAGGPGGPGFGPGGHHGPRGPNGPNGSNAPTNPAPSATPPSGTTNS